MRSDMWGDCGDHRAPPPAPVAGNPLGSVLELSPAPPWLGGGSGITDDTLDRMREELERSAELLLLLRDELFIRDEEELEKILEKKLELLDEKGDDKEEDDIDVELMDEFELTLLEELLLDELLKELLEELLEETCASAGRAIVALSTSALNDGRSLCIGNKEGNISVCDGSMAQFFQFRADLQYPIWLSDFSQFFIFAAAFAESSTVT